MTPDPTTLLTRLRGEGFAVRTRSGKLLVTPVAKLTGELRESVVEQREAIIASLLAEGIEEAKQKAIDAIAPPDFEDSPVVLDTFTLMRTNDDGDDEPPEYIAVSSAWLDELRQFAALKKKDTQAKKERRKKKVRKPREDQVMLPSSDRP